MTTDRIISDTAILLGTTPEGMAPGNAGVTSPLAAHILLEIESCAAEALLSTPRMQLTGWRLLPDDSMTIDGNSALLPLPDDFLMLFSLRLSGWQRDVTASLPADHPSATHIRAPWSGIYATPLRPIIIEGLDENGHRALRMLPASADDRMTEGWYMPAPKIKAGEIDIPPAAYHRTLRLIAERIRECTSW